MSWFESNLVQLMYWLEIVSQLLPLVLTIAVIFSFFLIQSYGRKLSRMEFYLDRIDNHLREITYFIKEHGGGKNNVTSGGESRKESKDSSDSKSGVQR